MAALRDVPLKLERKMTPKILPSLLMAAGSLILAWRMKYLLDALMRAQRSALRPTTEISLSSWQVGKPNCRRRLVLISM